MHKSTSESWTLAATTRTPLHLIAAVRRTMQLQRVVNEFLIEHTP